MKKTEHAPIIMQCLHDLMAAGKITAKVADKVSRHIEFDPADNETTALKLKIYKAAHPKRRGRPRAACPTDDYYISIIAPNYNRQAAEKAIAAILAQPPYTAAHVARVAVALIACKVIISDTPKKEIFNTFAALYPLTIKCKTFTDAMAFASIYIPEDTQQAVFNTFMQFYKA